MDASDARAILREHGYEPPAKGRLLPKWYALAEEIRSGAEPGSPPPADDEDYDSGITAADFPPDDEPPETPAPERRPRKPQRQRKRLTDRLRPDPKPGSRAKRRTARVPVDRIITRAWDGLARLVYASGLSQPVATTLQLQAPVAGLLLEDTVRGTIVDRVLQPVARAEERAEKVVALVGPPLIVAAMERAQGLPEPQRSMQLALLQTMLVEALTMWVGIAGDKMEQAAVRAQENEGTRRQVEQLIRQIFPQATIVNDDAPEPEMAGAV